jgi:hypothetical protein
VDVVVASWEFEPNNWLNLLVMLEPDDDAEPALDEEPSRLPPPQPDRAELAITISAIPAACFKRLPDIMLLLDPLNQRGAL